MRKLTRKALGLKYVLYLVTARRIGALESVL